MILVKRKLITQGHSRAATIPKDVLKMQNSKDGYVMFYVLTEQERKKVEECLL